MTMAKLGAACLAVLVVMLGTGCPVAEAELRKDRTEDITTTVIPVQTENSGEDIRRDNLSNFVDQTKEVATLENLPGKTWMYDKITRDDFHVAMLTTVDNLLLEPIAKDEGILESDSRVDLSIEHADVKTDAKRSIKKDVGDDVTKVQLAQFAVPPRAGTQREVRDEVKLPSALKYQYAYGFEMEALYLNNRDLNDNVADDSLFLLPKVFGLITYRPNTWLETTLELTLEQLVTVHEADFVKLPDGTLTYKEKQRLSLFVEQAYVTFKHLGPFEFTVGRRLFEDNRLWLYDASLDAFIVKFKQGDFHTEGSVSREDLVDGELLYGAEKGKIDNYILYTEYRGIEDHRLAAYAIKRDDRAGEEGKPLHLGMRAYGRPSDRFNYWAELGFTLGKDELNHDLEGFGFDVGGTYRFLNIPLRPSITLGYAFGSGDDNPDDNTNREFRQTGLESNEGKFSGVSLFKYYGEMLNPELSNLQILTAGVGFRPSANVFIDIVYHHYRLDKMADELRSSYITALMNQDDTHLSKEVGNEVDIILGFRNLFGLRRLGFDLRAGWFIPGKAYRIPEGDPDNPTFRKADQGFSAFAVIIFLKFTRRS